MKSKSAIWSSVVLLIIGVALIVMYDRENLLGTIVFIAGVMFILPAVINIIMLLREGRRRRAGEKRSGDRGAMSRMVGWVSSIGGIGLGVAMLLAPAVFESVLVYIFAGVMVLGGIYHFYVLSYAYRPVIFPGWLYILPAALIAGGAVILFSQMRYDVPSSMLITGIALVVFSVATFLEALSLYAFHRKEANTQAATTSITTREPAEGDTVDVTATEVDK